MVKNLKLPLLLLNLWQFLTVCKCFSGRYILSQYQDTNYKPLNGLMPKKSFVCCLVLSTIITIYSEVCLNVNTVFFL